MQHVRFRNYGFDTMRQYISIPHSAKFQNGTDLRHETDLKSFEKHGTLQTLFFSLRQSG